MAPDEITCPQCSVAVSREEWRRNGLLCSTCGFDLSEAEDPEDSDNNDDWDDQDLDKTDDDDSDSDLDADADEEPDEDDVDDEDLEDDAGNAGEPRALT